MRSLPAVLTNELNKECSRIGHLIELSLSSTMYYTDMDMNVVYDNGTGPHTYLSRALTFDNANYSLLPKADSLSFEIDNVSLEFSSLVMSQEVRGKKCTFYRAAFDAYLQVLAVAPVFIGFLDKIEVNQQRAKFDVYNQFIKWNTKTPRRTHTATCSWTFKDTKTCRYAGTDTSCDKSWDACVAKANSINFGGFRWLTSLENKDIYWGRVP